jgi:hypothetical protein
MKYYYEGYEIVAPLTITSNEPVFDADTISLRKQRATQNAQRWELSFGVVTTSPADLLASIIDFDIAKTMAMPQLNDVNKRIGTTTGSSSTTTTYTVTVQSGVYYIDGVQKPTLTFVKGNTYIFNLSHSSNGSHPLRFATQTDASGGTQYTTGVTVNGTQGQSGATITIVVASNAPSTLHYYCAIHGGMGNSINVSAASGITINYPKGAFVTGSNNKIYMVKLDAASVVSSNLYPTPPSGLTYSTVANATIKYYRSVDDLRGITFSDGLIANPGTIRIIEALG